MNLIKVFYRATDVTNTVYNRMQHLLKDAYPVKLTFEAIIIYKAL